jgi:choline dehydrogenase-like flavoprotein
MGSDDVDVVIVGSGFAGALIANELAKQGKKVVILEAGAGIPPNVDGYMDRFYKAAVKVPESPYTPSLSNDAGHFDEKDPKDVKAGRPTAATLGPDDWKNPAKSYLVQTGKLPFSSTYDRKAGGTSHWLGTCLRFVPSDFKMQTLYGTESSFVDWPIGYEDVVDWYGKAEAELGVSADVKEQKYLGINFPDDYQYPMPQISESLTDRAVRAALRNLKETDTAFLEMQPAPTEIPVRGLPAARNSQPYRNRRACAGNSNCIPICPIQAKYDPTITLNEALSNRHVRLLKHTVACEIVLSSDDLRSVSEIKYTRYSVTSDETITAAVKAKIFVIAANAIETSRLLLMSKNAALPFKIKTVANSSGMVGQHVMDHPYYVAWGQLPMTVDPVWPYRGPLITSGIADLCDGQFRGKRAAFRMDIGNEGWNFVIASVLGASDPDVTTIDFVNNIDRNRIKSKYGQLKMADPAPAKGLYGPVLAKALNDSITRQFRVGFLVEQTPDPQNCVTLSSEHFDGLGLPRPQITYDLSPYTRRGIAAAKKMRDLLFKKMGAVDFTMVSDNDPSRFTEQLNGEPVVLNFTGAGHIMGTFRMGTSAETSVVDSFQRSHDHDNLYLVGSGTFPTGGTANPTLTIAALALRTAERIAKRV